MNGIIGPRNKVGFMIFLRYVASQRSVSVAEAAQRFGIADSTARRYLLEMEERGHVTRFDDQRPHRWMATRYGRREIVKYERTGGA